MHTNLLYYLLIPISLLLLLMIFFFYLSFKRSKFKKYFHKSKYNNDSTTNQVYVNELRSLSLVKNKKINPEIIDKATTIVYEVEKLKKKNYDLSIEGEQNNEKYKFFLSNKLTYQIHANEMKIDKLSTDFFKTVGGILGNIKVIRKEVTNYKNGLRDFKEKCQSDIIQKLYPKSNQIIFEEIEQIKDSLGSLDKLVDSNELENAMIEFTNIKNRFLALINFANYCKKAEEVMFTSIPNYLKRLEDFFIKTKINTDSDLGFLVFEKQFADLKYFIETENKVFNINSIKKTEEFCNQVLKILFHLNNEINNEISSFTLIKKYKSELYIYKNEISKLFILLKNEFKSAKEIDKVYFANFNDEIDNLFLILTEVDLWIQKIETDETDTVISFASKVFKYKSFYYQVKAFYFLYIDLKRKIELFYLEGESPLLKFDRLSLLFRSINSYVKNNDIILKQAEQENLELIKDNEQKIIEIITHTEEGIIPLIANEYEKMLTHLSICVKTVGLKIEICKIFKKTIKLLSSKRSSNDKINEFVVVSENLYLEGEYNRALNNIIDNFGKRIN